MVKQTFFKNFRDAWKKWDGPVVTGIVGIFTRLVNGDDCCFLPCLRVKLMAEDGTKNGGEVHNTPCLEHSQRFVRDIIVTWGGFDFRITESSLDTFYCDGGGLILSGGRRWYKIFSRDVLSRRLELPEPGFQGGGDEIGLVLVGVDSLVLWIVECCDFMFFCT